MMIEIADKFALHEARFMQGMARFKIHGYEYLFI